ncbi:PIG-L deacetylase family protein [Streptomyces sp. TLI_105]|uniref:PIG-L deacetylase family protein n=1 Tax=Streptomyces sp. TLI_105 TaxID=1881019 RepID=UPI0008972475|nr:PIG-L family deacetylase [Streptomyces sp. TLI_105]SED91245.1 GlcNAc-PI de-N-acetylase [Streptomyces sp. TLI_105]
MADDPLTAFVRTVLGSDVPMIVLSPHLDDAVLSCGALLGWAGRRAPVTVATLFTEAAPPPYTLSARRYLRQIRAGDAEELFADRREEDRRVLELLGVDWRHVGLVDGLFRRLPRARPGVGRLAPLLPELAHVYPTYRLHLSRGRVSEHDAETLRVAGETIEALLPARSGGLVLAPLGVGGHADHVLARTAAERSGRRVVYYSDFPYDQTAAADAEFTGRHRLVARAWDRDLDRKAELVRGYRTQADALFPGGRIPRAPEVYLLPATGDTTVSRDPARLRGTRARSAGGVP